MAQSPYDTEYPSPIEPGGDARDAPACGPGYSAKQGQDGKWHCFQDQGQQQQQGNSGIYNCPPGTYQKTTGSPCIPDVGGRPGGEEADDFGSFQMPDWQPYKFDFNFGDAPAFTARRFTAPKPEDILNDPTYKWRLDQSLEALQNSAAAKGVARTGNTAKGLVDYAGNSASQEYDNAYNRAVRTYGLDYQADLDEYKPKLIGWQTNAAGKQRSQELSASQQWQKYLADLDWSKFLLTAPA